MSQAVLKIKSEGRGLPSPTIIAFVFLLVAAAAAVMWLVHQLADPTALPIRRVQIEGEFVHLQPQRLQEIVENAVDAGFFGVDVAVVRKRLLEEPWLRDATIRRVWPDTLRVNVIEQVPAARWGQQRMLNDVGDIFAPDPASIPRGLVRLDGPLGMELEMLELLRDLQPRFAALGLDLTELKLSARHAWMVVLGGGQAIELGRRDVERRLRRFMHAYRAGLMTIWMEVDRVDLRYPNGFAVSQRDYRPEHG